MVDWRAEEVGALLTFVSLVSLFGARPVPIPSMHDRG